MDTTKQLLSNITAKETAIKKALDTATAADISTEGKEEMIEAVENMINKLEDWKANLQQKTPSKKAS